MSPVEAAQLVLVLLLVVGSCALAAVPFWVLKVWRQYVDSDTGGDK